MMRRSDLAMWQGRERACERARARACVCVCVCGWVGVRIDHGEMAGILGGPARVRELPTAFRMALKSCGMGAD